MPIPFKLYNQWIRHTQHLFIDTKRDLFMFSLQRRLRHKSVTGNKQPCTSAEVTRRPLCQAFPPPQWPPAAYPRLPLSWIRNAIEGDAECCHCSPAALPSIPHQQVVYSRTCVRGQQHNWATVEECTLSSDIIYTCQSPDSRSALQPGRVDIPNIWWQKDEQIEVWR